MSIQSSQGDVHISIIVWKWTPGNQHSTKPGFTFSRTSLSFEIHTLSADKNRQLTVSLPMG